VRVRLPECCIGASCLCCSCRFFFLSCFSFKEAVSAILFFFPSLFVRSAVSDWIFCLLRLTLSFIRCMSSCVPERLRARACVCVCMCVSVACALWCEPRPVGPQALGRSPGSEGLRATARERFHRFCAAATSLFVFVVFFFLSFALLSSFVWRLLRWCRRACPDADWQALPLLPARALHRPPLYTFMYSRK